MSELKFRPAVVGDSDAIVQLVNSAYRGESSRAGWTTEDELLGGQRTDSGKIAEIIRTTDQVILLGFDGDRLVSSVNLAQEGDRCYLGMLTVDPQLQAGGYGRQTISSAETYAREQWGFDLMHMTVISLRHELIAYYLRRGYQPTGEKKDFPMDDPRYGLPKRRDFHLMVLRKAL